MNANLTAFVKKLQSDIEAIGGCCYVKGTLAFNILTPYQLPTNDCDVQIEYNSRRISDTIHKLVHDSALQYCNAYNCQVTYRLWRDLHLTTLTRYGSTIMDICVSDYPTSKYTQVVTVGGIRYSNLRTMYKDLQHALTTPMRVRMLEMQGRLSKFQFKLKVLDQLVRSRYRGAYSE